MTFNTALAVKVLAHIEDLNEYDTNHRHDQALWSTVSLPRKTFEKVFDKETGALAGYGSCGTAGCFAGWTMHLEGIALHYHVTEAPGFARLLGYSKSDVLLFADEAMDGRSVSVAACEALGVHIPVIDPECYHEYEDYGRDTDCSCELNQPHWNYEESIPDLFNGGNTLSQIYEYVAVYAALTLGELHNMVADEREKYVFDPEQWSFVEKEQVIEPAQI